MKWPRRGITIRLFIYVPLLAWAGWGAYHKYRERSAQAAAAQASRPSALPPEAVEIKRFEGPDGQSIEVPVVSQEAFEHHYGPVELKAANDDEQE